MARKKIKRIIQSPESYGDAEKQFPTVSIRPNATNKIHNVKQNIQRRNFEKGRSRAQRINRNPQEQVNAPIKFMQDIPKVKTDVCFVVGGGPSLNGFDFSELNGFDTIAVNKAVEFIQNPTYFITTDYSYFIKASLPLDKIKQKTRHTYFVANLSHPYMEYKNGQVVDTRRNFIYEDLYKYTGVIESYNKKEFGDTLQAFSHGDNSGHCGIQLALLLGYKKIYLLGFDLNSDGQTHFHNSYRERDYDSFKQKVGGYAETLLQSLRKYKGSQEIINLSANSVLATQPQLIKTQSFNDVLKEQGIAERKEFVSNTLDE